MNRIVQPELLDELPPDDPRALWSRRDLRRINAWMRNHVIMAKALRTALNGQAPKQITDLGAGDGHFLACVANKVSCHWPDVNVTLLDNRKVMSSRALAWFAPLGWRGESVEADVFDWLSTAAGLDVVVANLFLHHFEDPRLVELFRTIAGRARLLVAIEPRRAPWPLFCCRLLWAIGCNSVTRHDAAISARAGFSGRELSALWPADGGWQLTERRTGLFSHLFVARKVQQAI
ncbi:MAG TPA: methyltransferase domain-containing protein [Candidatus Limnocylindrales bacterium]|nr:methyltransferase domain-containing protein [Candidatus Limnocylindrales bacterium]